MEHHTIHANNNGEAESSNAAVEKSIILIRNLPKKEMEKLLIDLAKRKTSGRSLKPYMIEEVNFSDTGPDELVAIMLKQNGVDDEWFFLTRKNTICPGGVNVNRKAGEGKWKGNGRKKPICDGDETTGYRKYFIYKGETTTNGWCKFEYDPDRSTDAEQGNGYVFVKLYMKKPEKLSNNSTATRKAAQGSSRQQKGKKAAKYIQPLNAISFPHSVQNFPVITNPSSSILHCVHFSNPTYHVLHNDHHSQIQQLNANDQGFSKLPAMTGNDIHNNLQNQNLIDIYNNLQNQNLINIHNNLENQNVIDIFNDTDNPGASHNMFTPAWFISEDYCKLSEDQSHQLLDTDDFVNIPLNDILDFGEFPDLDTWYVEFLNQPKTD